MRRRIDRSGRLALCLCSLLLLAACASRHRAPRAKTKAAQASVRDSASRRVGDSLSTLRQLSAFIPDSSDLTIDSLGKHLRSAGKPGDSLVRRAGDSLQTTRPAALDSAARADSLAAERRRRSKETFDDIIAYKAQDSMVLLGQSLTYLFGESSIDYKDKGMDARFMRMNLDSNLVFAHYIIDSTGKASAYPKFRDGGESYEAKSLNYNFKTSKGYITGAVTQQGEGYITAERTKLVSNNCLFMEGGRYSTCDNHEHPHFYFQLTRAKARPQKNVVAGPSYLVLADVPMPIGLPFGFFPFNKTYSSGIVMPKYGEESSRGFYLREGGYYFAFNDYVDLSVTGDWYSLGSWGVNARSNYRKRYRYNGSFNMSYLTTKTGDRDVAGTSARARTSASAGRTRRTPRPTPSRASRRASTTRPAATTTIRCRRSTTPWWQGRIPRTRPSTTAVPSRVPPGASPPASMRRRPPPTPWSR